MHYRVLIYFCFFFFNGLPTTAQKAEVVRLPATKVKPGPYLRFDPVTIHVESFKKASTKSVILHDKQGYLWLKSEPNEQEALIRYDGNSYKAYAGTDWNLMENEKGELWATNERGIAQFDPVTERFHYYHNPTVKSQRILISIQGLNDHLFVSYQQFWQDDVNYIPLYEFDTHTKRYKKHNPRVIINGYTGQPEAAPLRLIRTYFQDTGGRCWGIVQDSTRAYKSLGYFEPQKNRCVWFPIRGPLAVDVLAKTPYHNLEVKDICSDGRYLWMGGFDRIGLLRFDTQTLKWRQYLFPFYQKNRIFHLKSRNQDQLWIRPDETSVSIFDKRTETLYTYNHELENDFSPDKRADRFIYDQKRTLWMEMGNRSGIPTLHVLNDSKQFFTLKDSLLLGRLNIPSFRALEKQDSNLIFTHLYDETLTIAQYNNRQKKITDYWRLPLDGNIEQRIYGMVRDSLNDKIWLYGKTFKAGALFWFDEKKQKVLPIKAVLKGVPIGVNKVERIEHIRALAQDPLGNVWFSYRAGINKGLAKYNHLTKEFEGYEAGTHGLLNNDIMSILFDSRGVMWIGYRNNGPLVWFDPMAEKSILQKQISSFTGDGTDILKMIEDKKRKVIWISKFYAGLWKYDMQKDTYEKIPEIPTALGLFQVKNGDLWIKTPDGLLHYNPDTKRIRTFGQEYDLNVSEFVIFSKSQDDEFYYGKFHFRPQDIQADTSKPNVVFSFINVFDQPLSLPGSLNHTEVLELNHNQNFFTVGFSALSYFQQDKNQYAYQLAGFNKDWVNVGNKPLATFTNVPPDEYVLKIKGSNYDGTWSDVRSLKIIIHPAFWQTWWFKTLFGLLILGVVYSIYRYQLNQKTLKNRLKAEEALRKQEEALRRQREAEFSNRIAHTEMAALRAQMNPHFIFNCLNSIQLYTTQNNTEKATEYLTKFSRLIRLVLENSRSEKVTLENELETLQLYLDMETMRFRGKVNYQIYIAPNIDQTYLQIPPLLVQPFVENAIWHGLMHKDEGGTVHIEVTQPKPDLLQVEIRDDGIGRQKAAEYKSKSATKNKSFGMKVTAERIELINQLYHTNTRVEIIDLKNRKNEVMGTKVTVKIPI